MWETPEGGEVLRESEMHTVATYISRRQWIVAQWVAIIPIFDVCTWKKGFDLCNGGDNCSG